MLTSKRADRVWKRLVESYGSRVAENYGRDVPKPWIDAVDDLTDEQIVYGLRKVMRESPIHPPALGQFVAACIDMPQPQTNKGPNLQEQLSEYVMRKYFPSGLDSKFTADQRRQSAQPWTYLYREWNDDSRPKHLQKCAECTGVLIPAFGDLPGFRVNVVDMLGDRMSARLTQDRPRLSAPDWMTLAQKVAAGTFKALEAPK